MLANFALLDFGMPELLVILAIVLLLFGSKKLPELSKALGQSAKNLKDGLNEAQGARDDVKQQIGITKQSFTGAQPQPTPTHDENV